MNIYVGRCKCGAIQMAVVDVPKNRDFTSRGVVEIVKHGYKLEFIPKEQLKLENWECTCEKEQGGLFE